MSLLGSDFGTVPMGMDQVRARAERDRRDLWPNEERRRSCGVCFVDLFPLVDVSCPEHGLEAFVRSAFPVEVPA